jgi:hypothetical protein
MSLAADEMEGFYSGNFDWPATVKPPALPEDTYFHILPNGRIDDTAVEFCAIPP